MKVIDEPPPEMVDRRTANRGGLRSRVADASGWASEGAALDG